MDKKYFLGIQEIDTQHMGIFAAIEPLQRAVAANREAPSLTAALHRLQEVMVAHFDYEESFMGSIDCPDLEEHKLEHAELTALLDDCIRASTPADAGTMGRTIGSRVSEHLLEYDVKMEEVVENLVAGLRRHESGERD